MRPRDGPWANTEVAKAEVATTAHKNNRAINFMPYISDTSHSVYVFADDCREPLFGFRRDLIRRGNNSMAKRVAAFALALLISDARDGPGDELLRVSRVAIQIFDHHLDRDRVMIGMPAIVIRNQRYRRVTYLGFAREFRFLKVGHPDHGHSPRAIRLRFRFSRKRRAFHAEICPAALHVYV